MMSFCQIFDMKPVPSRSKTLYTIQSLSSQPIEPSLLHNLTPIYYFLENQLTKRQLPRSRLMDKCPQNQIITWLLEPGSGTPRQINKQCSLSQGHPKIMQSIASIQKIKPESDSYDSLYQMSTNNQNLEPNFIPSGLSSQPEALTVSLDQLITTLVQAEQEAQPALASMGEMSQIIQEYTKIQGQIMEIVEMRKDMQKMLEIEALQSTHFGTLKPLIQQNLNLQTLVDQSAATIKQLQSRQIQQALQFYNSNYLTNGFKGVPEAAVETKLLLEDMKRWVTQLPLRYSSSVEKQDEDRRTQQSFVLVEKATRESDNRLLQQQHEGKSILNKQIYRQLFQDVSFREQLLIERQSVFEDYQASSHELVEALLRQRQKQNNLQRAEHEKHEHLLGIRHRFDIELEKLTHHQSHLVSLYEFDLLNLKKHLHETEEQLKHSQQHAHALEGELTASKKECKQLRQQINGHAQAMRTVDSALKTALSKSQQLQILKNSLEQQLAAKASNAEKTAEELSSFQLALKDVREEVDRLKKEKAEIITRNQEIQSQLSEAILRSSQSKQVKQELAKKLEESQSETAKLQQISSQLAKDHQTQHQTLRKQIQESQLQRIELQKQIKTGQATRVELQQKIASLQQQITSLEDELTQAFIHSNQERKELNFEIERKEQALTLLKQQNQLMRQEIQFLQTNSLSIEDWSYLKERIANEIQAQMQSAVRAVDEFAERISNYPSNES